MRRVQVLFLAALAFAVYANTLSNGFVNDDEHQVLLNPWIKDIGSVPEILSGSVWGFVHGRTTTDYYRPVMHLVYLANHRLFGLEAWGFHLVNVLFHVANTILVFTLTTRLAGVAGWPGAGPGARAVDSLLAVPFVSALLFATHPVHTEAVAWIASIPELSFSMFCLLSLCLYIGEAGRSRTGVTLSVVAFCFALLCKETAVVLPALLIAYDIAILRERRSTTTILARYAPYALAAGIYGIVRQAVLSGRVSPGRIWDLGAFDAAINALVLFRDYVYTVLVPFHLSFWHPFHQLSSLASFEGVSSLAVAAAFACAAVVSWRKHRPSFFCLALFLVPLLPAFYITALPGRPFAERYLYLPSLGLAILIALGLRRLTAVRGMSIVAIAAIALVTAVYSVATIRRNRVWKDSFTLYADTVLKTADAPVPPHALAASLLDLGRVDEAIALYRVLVQANPGNATFESSLGSAFLLKGRTAEAIEHLRRALAIDPRSLESYNDLAIALKRAGLAQEAIALYRQALEIDPAYADAHFNLGSALADAGERAEALEHYRAAVQARPESAYYRSILGIEYAEQGRLAEAIEQFREAVRVAPSEPAYRNNLERALALERRR